MTQPTRSLDLTFPNHENTPTRGSKNGLNSRVTGDIRIKFFLPEVLIATRRGGAPATWMAMPEATVYENRPSARAVGNVRRARQVLVVHAESVSESVK